VERIEVRGRLDEESVVKILFDRIALEAKILT
jgi:hypothetical protein